MNYTDRHEFFVLSFVKFRAIRDSLNKLLKANSNRMSSADSDQAGPSDSDHADYRQLRYFDRRIPVIR